MSDTVDPILSNKNLFPSQTSNPTADSATAGNDSEDQCLIHRAATLEAAGYGIVLDEDLGTFTVVSAPEQESA